MIWPRSFFFFAVAVYLVVVTAAHRTMYSLATWIRHHASRGIARGGRGQESNLRPGA